MKAILRGFWHAMVKATLPSGNPSKEFMWSVLWWGLPFVLIYFIGNLIADFHPAWRSSIYVFLAMAGTASGFISREWERQWYDKVKAEYKLPFLQDDERQNDPVLLSMSRHADLFKLGFYYGVGVSFGLIIYVEAPDQIAEAQRRIGELLNEVRCLLPEGSMLGRYCR